MQIRCCKNLGKSILEVPDTGTRVLNNTKPFLSSSIVSFWITPAHSKERKYHIFRQYWYTKSVTVFTNTGTYQYLGPELYFFPIYFCDPYNLRSNLVYNERSFVAFWSFDGTFPIFTFSSPFFLFPPSFSWFWPNYSLSVLTPTRPLRDPYWEGGQTVKNFVKIFSDLKRLWNHQQLIFVKMALEYSVQFWFSLKKHSSKDKYNCFVYPCNCCICISLRPSIKFMGSKFNLGSFGVARVKYWFFTRML